MAEAQKKELRRSFGGKIDGFVNKVERRLEQKHLKAYLAGHKRFRIAVDDETREPIYTRVIEIWS